LQLWTSPQAVAGGREPSSTRLWASYRRSSHRYEDSFSAGWPTDGICR